MKPLHVLIRLSEFIII